MLFTIPTEEGEPLEFECADTVISRWVCETILRGKTYPHVPFVEDVRTIVDVGANCGAASVHLARHHPGATIHALEPGREQRTYLERNAARLDNVHVHPIGLSDQDGEVPLYKGRDDSITASVHHRDINREDHEMVSLRHAGAWAAEQGIDSIDILKLDVEGSEVQVLEALKPLLGTVKVLYVEYDSRQARRRIDDLLRATHELFFAMFLAVDQGEEIYLRADLADHPDAGGTMEALFKG